MKIELRDENAGTGPRLEGPVIDWAKGLRERKVARMELYNQPNDSIPLALVVTLVDGSLYFIQRVSSKGTSTNRNIPTGTIETTTSSHFVSRPVIVVTFRSKPELWLILYVCYSVPTFDQHKPNIDNRSFGLTVLLNTVRHVLLCTVASSPESPTEAQSPLKSLWRDVYQLTQSHDHDSWQGSPLERTKDLTRELIYKAAYNSLSKKIGAQWSDSTLTAYSVIARLEELDLKENSQPSPSDMAWDSSWAKHTRVKLWMRRLGNNSRLTSQMDARDLPHRYRLSEIQQDTNLVHDGLIGHEWDGITSGPTCTSRPQIDWQIAAHLAWSYAWPTAFKEGKKMAEDVLQEFDVAPASRPQTKPPSSEMHPAVRGVINLGNWVASQFSKGRAANEEPMHNVDQAINKWCYQDLKRIAQQKAKRKLDTQKNSKNAYSETKKKRSEYKDKALKRAKQTMGRQGGEGGLEYLSQQEWRRVSKGSVLRHLPEQGRVVEGWKKDFRDNCEQAWERSWADTWLAVWEDAYESAESKGIEFGVMVGLEERYNTEGPLGELMGGRAYEDIQQHIEQAHDTLKHTRLLIQELNHISSLVAVHNDYSNCVTIRALVPDKDKDLEDMSRILPKQPVTRELSYMELRHFIMEEYFKNNLRKHRTSFQNGVSRSWQDLSKFKLGGANASRST
ncbi:hypothetical protein FRC11_013531 [Ceratobasidium sp. 423]|nr:hypothetical protein FRC11_013531 [Ceratobasidium sp. 423]